MKRRKENDKKGLRGSWDGQAQGNSETYGGEQDLEVEYDTNLHYSNQYNYIPARKYNGVAKIRVLSTRRLIKISPLRKIQVGTYTKLLGIIPHERMNLSPPKSLDQWIWFTILGICIKWQGTHS